MSTNWFDEALAEATEGLPKKGRKTSRAVPYGVDIRREAVRLVTEEGKTYPEAAKIVGVSLSSVYAWVRKDMERRGVIADKEVSASGDTESAVAETPAPERAETDGCASLGDALRRLAENVDRNETELREVKARLDASIARYAEIAHAIVDVLMGGETHHD